MAACVLLALGVASAPASAHAHLKYAMPAVGSKVTTVPTEVAITFTEGVQPQFCTITVQDAKGTQFDTGAPHLAGGGDTTLAVALKPLTPGTYTVVWHATATDTHKTEGSFNFTVMQ
jgi:methionine-rich copper-binding protein CopC